MVFGYIKDKNIITKQGHVWTNKNCREAFENFINQHKHLFEKLLSNTDDNRTNEEKWFDDFDVVKNYVKEHKKLPNSKDKKNNGGWLDTQKQNYKKKQHIVWTNKNCREAFENFINQHKHLFEKFLSNTDDNEMKEEKWFDSLNVVKGYVKEHKLPKATDKNNGGWLHNTQKNNYKKKQIRSGMRTKLQRSF